MRKAVIAGNWKMNKTVSEAVDLISNLKGLVSDVTDLEIVVAPPFLAIYHVAQEVKGSNIHVSAQDVFWEEEGAYTGAVSPKMLLDIGCEYVIIGHSERRQYFSETDETVNKKIKSSLQHGLIPIFCVGETLQQREAGETFNIIETQIKSGLSGFSPSDMEDVIIAYEPVWAIGTGRTATGEQAEEVHSSIRKLLKEIYKDTADSIRILYGGSVKPDNIDGLMAKPNIDGALVGGASLKADDFARIVKYQR
ncbi:MAG: triose-phosphate isomerase [Thermodesulfobacteriota bacterium]